MRQHNCVVSVHINSNLLHFDLINVVYLTALYLYQVNIKLFYLNDIINDVESIQKLIIMS